MIFPFKFAGLRLNSIEKISKKKQKREEISSLKKETLLMSV